MAWSAGLTGRVDRSTGAGRWRLAAVREAGCRRLVLVVVPARVILVGGSVLYVRGAQAVQMAFVLVVVNVIFEKHLKNVDFLGADIIYDWVHAILLFIQSMLSFSLQIVSYKIWQI